MSRGNVLRLEFSNFIKIYRYYASSASLFIYFNNKLPISFFGFFKLHEDDGGRIVEGDGVKGNNDRKHDETEEQKATRGSIIKDLSNLNDGVSTIIHLLYCL